MGRVVRTLLAGLATAVVFVWAAASAGAAGYATDEQGRLYRVFPAQKKVELLGTVRVPTEQGGKTVMVTPTLTDIALHDEHGLYGISYTELYKIELRDPAQSKRVGSLSGSRAGSFNALEQRAKGPVIPIVLPAI